MGDFESLGDIMRGSGKKRYEKTVHGRIVEGGVFPASSLQRHQPDMPSNEQLGKPGDAVIQPFSRRSHVPGDVQASLCSSPSPGGLSSSSVCPICKGAGLLRRDVPYGHPDFGKTVACVCKERELHLRRQQKMIALSERFGFQQGKVLSNFRCQLRGVQEAVQEAKGMIERLEAWAAQRNIAQQTKDVAPPPQEWLVFRGPVGIGKTHLAMAITHACIDAGIVALFATVPDLLDHLRATYEPTARAVYDDMFTQLRDAEVLVLDDLGTQRSSPWADEKIFQLINHRYNFGWPTVITLNKKAWTYLDERISSRLQDAGLVLLVDMEDAQDYRLRQGKNAARRTLSPESSVNSER